jgi:hypothetical protein
MSTHEPAVTFSRPFANLGQLVMTPGVETEIPIEEILSALRRHELGDWGEVPPEDSRANDRALRDGERLLSAYTSAGGVRFWIITEADRSSTCILLPDEY